MAEAMTNPQQSLDAAEEIVRDLYGRGGFDAWWSEIDDETRGEILIAMANIIWRHRA